MIEAIRTYFKTQEDTDPAFVRLTRNILLFTLFATLLPLAANATKPNTSNSDKVTVLILTLALLVEIISLAFVLRGKILLAKTVVPISLVIAVTTIAYGANSLHDIAIVALPSIIIIATLLQGRRAMIVTLPIAVFGIILLGTLDMLGITRTNSAAYTGVDDIVVGSTILIASSGALNLLIGRLNQALKIAQVNELAQTNAIVELKELQTTLEQRVVERTTKLEEVNRRNELRAQQFEAITLVGNAISSVRLLDDLLPKITELISKQFGYYHVGIFLNDVNNEYAILTVANSEGGKEMISRGHRLRIGEQGIVGNAISNGQARIALDVGKDAVYFGNRELPNTHSEIALPLKMGETVIGALDVQSVEAAAFDEEDTKVLSLLAEQVSMAIENARLFEQSRKSLAESEAVYRQYIRQAWNRLPKEQNLAGFRYNALGASPIETQEMANHINDGKETVEELQKPRISVPIAIRGETIGTLFVQIPDEKNINNEQLDVVNAVAERVALSAENARLFEETNRRAERERLVSDITVKIRSTNDPDAMIKIALDELKQALGATKVQLVPHTVRTLDTREQVTHQIPQSNNGVSSIEGKE